MHILEFGDAMEGATALPDTEFSVFLDNASIINACSLISTPALFDPYKLLDLETFCEAFLLYDRVHTLIGGSFTHALRGGPGDTTYEIYGQLAAEELLQPMVIGAGTVHYRLEYLDLFDEVAQNLDIDSILATLNSTFGSSMPWEPDDDEQLPGSTIVIGEETATSDSYPIYYFPTTDRSPAPDNYVDAWGFEINHNRRTESIEAFASQTFLYIAAASLLGRPYLCSSVRVPMVADVLGRLRRQFFSALDGSMQAVTEAATDKIKAVETFFGEGGIHFVFLPVLLLVLRESSSRQDIIPTLLRMREEPLVIEFRDWCRALSQAWRRQDVDALAAAIAELRVVSMAISRSSGLDAIDGSVSQIPDIRVLTDEGLARVQVSESELVAACYNPSLGFLTSAAGVLSSVADHGALIERFFDRKLSDGELNRLRGLLSARGAMYSRGREAPELRPVEVAHMEVNMGDVFRDIEGSIIATRGSIAEGVIQLQGQGRSDLAEAVATLDNLIAEATPATLSAEEKERATEVLKGITEEAARPNANRSVLHSLSESLASMLKAAQPLAAAAGSLIAIIGSLWP